MLTLYVDSDTMTVVGAGVVPEGQRTEVLFDTALDERGCPGGHALSKTLIPGNMTTYTIPETINILAIPIVVHKARPDKYFRTSVVLWLYRQQPILRDYTVRKTAAMTHSCVYA